MKKIGVISDAHGNLQALTAVLDYLENERCDEIIHTGDAVDIGANSLECVKLLQSVGATCLLGNHDLDFISDNTEHKTLSHVSSRHKQYVFESLRGVEEIVKGYKLYAERICGGQKILFEHYCRLSEPLPNGYLFKPIANDPTAEVFDEMYANYTCDAVFFGHKHEPCDVQGKRLYVDVGSVGCHPKPFARGIVLEYDICSWRYRRFEVPYDRDGVQRSMTEGALPDGEYLYDFYFLHKGE